MSRQGVVFNRFERRCTSYLASMLVGQLAPSLCLNVVFSLAAY